MLDVTQEFMCVVTGVVMANRCVKLFKPEKYVFLSDKSLLTRVPRDVHNCIFLTIVVD